MWTIPTHSTEANRTLIPHCCRFGRLISMDARLSLPSSLISDSFMPSLLLDGISSLLTDDLLRQRRQQHRNTYITADFNGSAVKVRTLLRTWLYSGYLPAAKHSFLPLPWLHSESDVDAHG
ncbi:uncharacterized protein DS421_15g499390 [Arachis hypogaea]|nr:uncharacterized protein DS421_15g499390 [Arachis hypogaea]